MIFLKIFYIRQYFSKRFKMQRIECLESIQAFKVSFGGRNDIDAEIFTSAMNDTLDLVKKSAMIIDPHCFVKLNIKTNQQGSFATLLEVITNYAPDLVTYGLPIAQEILSLVCDWFTIKQHLKGQAPLDVTINHDMAHIKNQDHETLTISKKATETMFKDCNIDKSIINITQNIYHGNRENLIIETDDREIHIPKQDFEQMQRKIIPDKHTRIIQQEPINVKLLLKKPDLLGNSKWEFLYNKAIEAKIEDKDFLNNVKRGKIKNLYAGVRVPCLLKISFELDEHNEIILNSDKYVILAITGDIIEPDDDLQQSLL